MDAYHWLPIASSKEIIGTMLAMGGLGNSNGERKLVYAMLAHPTGDQRRPSHKITVQLKSEVCLAVIGITGQHPLQEVNWFIMRYSFPKTLAKEFSNQQLPAGYHAESEGDS